MPELLVLALGLTLMPALLSERKCSKAKRKNNPDKSGTKSGTDSDQDRLSQQDYHHHRQERDQEPPLKRHGAT
jgi:hypothetical protein